MSEELKCKVEEVRLLVNIFADECYLASEENAPIKNADETMKKLLDVVKSVYEQGKKDEEEEWKEWLGENDIVHPA